MSYTDALSFRD